MLRTLLRTEQWVSQTSHCTVLPHLARRHGFVEGPGTWVGQVVSGRVLDVAVEAVGEEHALPGGAAQIQDIDVLRSQCTQLLRRGFDVAKSEAAASYNELLIRLIQCSMTATAHALFANEPNNSTASVHRKFLQNPLSCIRRLLRECGGGYRACSC